MEEHITKPHPRSQAASARVARPWRSLPEITTPAPSLTTVLCRAGEGEMTANWVMEEHLTKPLPRSPAALVRVARPLRFLPDPTTPAPSSTTAECRAGEAETTANWVMEEHLTKPHPRSRAASVRVAQQ